MKPKEDDVETDIKIIQSYVWHKGKRYFVSTIERDSSALGMRERYNETIVWESEEKKPLGRMLAQDSDNKNSIRKHQNICSQIFENGLDDL